MFKYSFYACIIGFVLDIIFGDPYFGLHPIRLIGNLISFTEKGLRKAFNNKHLFFAGILLNLTVAIISVSLSFLLLFFTYKYNAFLGLIIESIICFFMISTKSLKTESMKVYYALKEGNIEKARQAVSMIVGRDTAVLDDVGIAKAATETVAENLSDGVIAPLLFMITGGAVFGVLYKTINTMDSMVGYKNDKYILFGRFSAKMDDVFNFIPSRISALIMILAALVAGENYKNAYKIFKRDRFNHASPNSAQTEAVCAGALNIRLAGDAWYFGKLYKKPYIGDDIEPVTYSCIKRANRLMYASAALALVIFSLIRILFFYFIC